MNTENSRTVEFFDLLHPNLAADERIELRYLSRETGIMRREFVTDSSMAARRALAVCEDVDVYFGVATRHGEDGTKSGVSRSSAVWADLDAKDRIPSEDRPVELDKLPLTPSMIVDSGYGHHLYWLLVHPAVQQDELVRAEDAMRHLSRGLGGDAVHDRSRILRVPGTFNHKRGERRPVSIECFTPERRYKLGDLHDMAHELAKDHHLPTAESRSVATDVLGSPIKEGGRNLALTSVAGSLRHRGLDEYTIRVVLGEVNQLRCIPPLSEAEVLSIARSIGRYAAGSPFYPKSRARRIYRGGNGE